MTTETTLLVGIGIGLALSFALRRNSVVRAPRYPEQTYGSPAVTVAPAGTTSVTIVSGTRNKINDIKAVRACTHLGLKESKDMIDNLPAQLVAGTSAEHAQRIAGHLEAAGLSVRVSDSAQ